MLTNEQITVQILFPLLRAGLYGVPAELMVTPSLEEWNNALDLVTSQGVLAVAGEGLSFLPQENLPKKEILLQWIGASLQQKQVFMLQRKMVDELCEVWKDAGIGVFELKGNSIGKFYYAPDTRYSCDFDCLLSDYEAGNKMVESKGVEVNRDFYKNSSFHWEDLYVENHQFCTPVRGNKDMKRLERVLRDLIANEKDEALANFNSLFLMEHSWTHFFENALTLKHLCDWTVFRRACGEKADWKLFEREAKACGFWKFAYSFGHLADMLDGKITLDDLTKEERRLLADMLDDEIDVSVNEGWKTRIQLFKNYFTQSWKYRLFSNHSAIYSLLRTVNGFVFDRNPKI